MLLNIDKKLCMNYKQKEENMKTIKKGLPSTLFETSNRERNKSTT
jgi:hypothetical protein